MRILVTGGTGFIGSNLTNHLTDLGHEVLVLGTKTEQMPKASRYLGLHLGMDYRWRICTLGNIDVCFHQAANNDTLDMDREEMMFANFGAPKSLFYELRFAHNCKKFVYASSSAVYGDSAAPFKEGITLENPLNPYGESKLAFDKWAMEEVTKWPNTSIVGLRYTNVYGYGESHKGRRASMIYQLIRKALNKEKITLFKYGEQKRDWIYVKDVIQANISAMNYNGSEIFNCGSGCATSFNEIFSIITKKLKLNITPEYIDCPFLNAYQDFTLADMNKAKEKLNFSPTYKVDDAISELIDMIK